MNSRYTFSEEKSRFISEFTDESGFF